MGRLDDQIVLLNGEKTNPIPMGELIFATGSVLFTIWLAECVESEILRSPIIQYAAMFGRERNQTGVLIEITEDLKYKTQSQGGRVEIINQIWCVSILIFILFTFDLYADRPYVERANQVSSTHSRLTRNAVIFTSPTRILPRTPKGTVSRASVLGLYADEIEEMYAMLDSHAGLDIVVVPPKTWTNKHEIEEWVGNCVKEVLGRRIESNADFFQQGMDRSVI